MTIAHSVKAARASSLLVLWFAAIGLVINDHWLKHDAAWPRWLTGKLSDFLGLLLAVAILIAVGNARSRWARLLCTTSVALPFAAINLSHGASALLIECVGMIGLSWRLWPDPSDLIALGVLPLGVMLGAALTRNHRRSPWTTRLSVVAAAAACMASGEDTYSSPAYFLNATDQVVVVDVSYLQGELSCYSDLRLEDELTEGFLRHSDFDDDATRFRLEPKQVLPLHEPGSGRCGLARIEFEGHTVAVGWFDAPFRSLPPTLSNSEFASREGMIVFEASQRAPEGYRWTVGEGLVVLDLADDAAAWPESTCAAAEIPRLSYSLPDRAYDVQIGEMRAVGADCFSFRLTQTPAASDLDAGTDPGLAQDGGALRDSGTASDSGIDAASAVPAAAIEFEDRSVAYLCGVGDLFPFEVGDRVNITDLGFPEIENGRRSLRLWRQHQLHGRGTGEPEPSECGLVRDPCGAIWQPLDVPATRGTLGDQILERRVRAFRTVLAREECPEELRRIDTWFEIVEIGER